MRIKDQYRSSLSVEQINLIDKLIAEPFIVVDKPTQDNIEFFSKQEGITDSNNYSTKYIPSAHGGRTKGDNKIHIYPFAKSLESCTSNEEIINTYLDNIIVHEIFHYFIRPNINDNSVVNDDFMHFITEGLVQLYAEDFSKKNRLNIPKSNYNKNVNAASELITNFPSQLSKNKVNTLIFNSSVDDLLLLSNKGNIVLKQFNDNKLFKSKLNNFLINVGKELGMAPDSEELKGIIKHYSKIDDINFINQELTSLISNNFINDDNKKNEFIYELNSFNNYDKTK